jgi:hypothetical protein
VINALDVIKTEGVKADRFQTKGGRISSGAMKGVNGQTQKTMFADPADDKNHVFGDTNIHGTTKFDGKIVAQEDASLKGKLCMDGLCITKEDLKRMKDRQYIFTGAILVDGTGEFPQTDVGFRPRNITLFTIAGTDSFNVDKSGSKNKDRPDCYVGPSSGFARRTSNGHIIQQFVHGGVSGNSTNSTSHFASNSECIGVRFADTNGKKVGEIRVKLKSFDKDGFTLKCDKFDAGNVDGLVVLFTAYG